MRSHIRLPEQMNSRFCVDAVILSPGERCNVAAELAEIITTGSTSNGWKVTLISEIFETGRIQNKAIPRRGVQGAKSSEWTEGCYSETGTVDNNCSFLYCCR